VSTTLGEWKLTIYSLQYTPNLISKYAEWYFADVGIMVFSLLANAIEYSYRYDLIILCASCSAIHVFHHHASHGEDTARVLEHGGKNSSKEHPLQQLPIAAPEPQRPLLNSNLPTTCLHSNFLLFFCSPASKWLILYPL
jgi:hypothetical protein